MGADDGWEAWMSARAAERWQRLVNRVPAERQPVSNGYEWIWTCPYCTRPSWQTSSLTFVGALEKGRRHLALLSWPTGEYRYDGHPACLDKVLTA